MRDEFGEIDPDEIDIDLLDADPSAFDAHDDPNAVEPSLATRDRRRWLLPAAITGVIAIAVGLVAWSPWSEDNTTAYHDGDSPELTLTDQLVFDKPPAELTAASLGTATSEDGISFEGFDEAEGYFFAEPGAAWDIFLGRSDGRWAAFFATKEGAEGAPDMQIDDGQTAPTVQGAPAVLAAASGREREIRFGPVGGWLFSVVAAGMSVDEMLAFAEVVGVDDGVPTISDGRVLGDMVPIGPIRDYEVSMTTVISALSPFGAQPNTVSIHYGDFANDDGIAAFSVATRPVLSERTLSVLQFTIAADEGHSVHGLPAVVVDESGENPFGFAGGRANTLVAWVEGGRLIVVAGTGDLDSTLELAESVRPATDQEWADVLEVAQHPLEPSIPLVPDDRPDFGGSDPITIYNTTDADTGDVYSLAALFDDGTMTVCSSTQNGDSDSNTCETSFPSIPLLTTMTLSPGKQFVYAVIDREVGDVSAELRITLADGTVETVALEEFGPLLPGPAAAALLPEDHGAVELLIGAKVVATL